MFLWRKLTILEGNFFILEKRVNLIKKESKENNIVKNIERSNAVMNEIFNDGVNKSKGGVCQFPLQQVDEITIITTDIPKTKKKETVQPKEEYNDDVQISFSSSDIDEKIKESIDPIDIITAVVEEKKDVDTVSITSEFVFNASNDKQKDQKKLAKMNIDKLKEICVQNNLSVEGTKSQLIGRILENTK
jgi:hypothetical protein